MTVLNKQPQAYKLKNPGANPLDKLKLIQDFMTVLITIISYRSSDFEQKCRVTVFKSVGELSPKAVSGNCLVPS